MFWVVMLAIILFGVFLRAYHFSDWLHFELDQSRDAKIIDLAIKEGPEALPLLGPKAAGSFLRLGPVFYYFKYLSALIFGNTPGGMTVIIMLFGILAMPAFYFLVRRYFERYISLALLLLFSTSLFLVMYSRFSWNPNALPLFVILTMYSLLRAVDAEEKRRGLWLLGAAFCLAVATQLHFLAFVSLPVITIIFLIIKRPKIRWTYWIGAIAIILIMNLPVFLNEIKTGGDNFKEFKKVVMGKTTKDEDRTILEKIGRDYRESSMGYFLILSSQNNDTLKMRQKLSDVIACDRECKREVVLGLVGLAIFSAGLLLLLKNALFEVAQRKKDFLVIIAIWFIITFGLFMPLSFDISPRYWLLVSASPFIFLGFSFEFLGKIIPKKFALIFVIIITLIFTVSSLYETQKRFKGLQEAPYKNIKVSADRILREKYRVTLEQQYIVMDYVESFYKKNGYPVYLNSDPYYRRSFLFHLDNKNIPRDDFRNVTSSSKIYRNGNYFLIYPTNSNLEKDLAYYSAAYDEVSRKQFGTLTVIRLIPKENYITDIQQEIAPRENSAKNTVGVPDRFTWEEIFNESSDNDVEE